eukprot:872046-Amphidinium_carterae.1
MFTILDRSLLQDGSGIETNTWVCTEAAKVAYAKRAVCVVVFMGPPFRLATLNSSRLATNAARIYSNFEPPRENVPDTLGYCCVLSQPVNLVDLRSAACHVICCVRLLGPHTHTHTA